MSADKMIMRKDGPVGHMIFNNPEKHNAVSLEMWDAAEAILEAFRAGRFEARRFRGYERRVRRGVAPLFRFIRKYYEPAFLELFLKPRNRLGMFDAVLSVLAGGAFSGMPLRTRLSLEVLFVLVRANVWLRRRAGLPVESRLEW